MNLRATLASTDYDLSRQGVLIREPKFQLICNFIDFKVLHCPRTCNRVAHDLASFGAQLERAGVMLWPDSVPACVQTLVVS